MRHEDVSCLPRFRLHYAYHPYLTIEDPPSYLNTDKAVRVRIHQRYPRYAEQKCVETLLDTFPRSNAFLFTYGDVVPRNTVAGQYGHTVGVIGYELAGRYLDYWEYANIMKPSMGDNWQSWMDHTASQRWDLTRITAARRALS